MTRISRSVVARVGPAAATGTKNPAATARTAIASDRQSPGQLMIRLRRSVAPAARGRRTATSGERIAAGVAKRGANKRWLALAHQPATLQQIVRRCGCLVRLRQRGT